ncbi:hypothetical protein [Luteimicrobium sp. DT211]|uniref:hypothetical protein n=1 Tax=Luteimicrobium sp. DT211 TaxID=3393412 RepID=UPI003CEC6040
MPSEQLWSRIPPMRPVAPMAGPPSRQGTAALVVGLVLAVVGLGVLVAPLATFDQLCRFAPCEPLVPTVGFRAADDGGIVVETGPRTAAEMTSVTVYGRLPAHSPDDALPPVLWEVQRRGQVASGWDGAVELGRVPRGFVEKVAPATSWRSAAVSVGVENGCYEGWDVLPRGRLSTDRVVYFSGTEYDVLDQFRTEDSGFTPCDADARLLARRPDLRGLAVGLAGVGLVVLGVVLRRRRW